MRRLVSISIMFLAVLTATPAFPDDTCLDPTELPTIPDTLLKDLTGWIALNTHYDVSLLYRQPPDISFCYVGDYISLEGQSLRVEPELRAAFDLPKRQIHLVLPWSPDNPRDRSVLLHELVHDVQLANTEWPCVGAPEIEAYLLQHAYLKSFGIASGFDWPSIFRLSICPEDN